MLSREAKKYNFIVFGFDMTGAETNNVPPSKWAC